MASKYVQHQVDKATDWSSWIYPYMSPHDYKMQCCDCGLVHDFEFAVNDDDGSIRFRVRRNNRATGQTRRKRNAES